MKTFILKIPDQVYIHFKFIFLDNTTFEFYLSMEKHVSQ